MPSAAEIEAHRQVWEDAGVEYGLCLCGCGERTVLAEQTARKFGRIKGHPGRYVCGHHRRVYPRPEPPNPSGICQCGCGRETERAASTLPRWGWVKGEHKRFVRGHHLRGRLPANWKPERWREEDCGYDTPCWIWLLAVNDGGYGIQSRTLGGSTLAHRALWESRNGPVPDGSELHHRCEQGLCVRPDHLQVLTKAEHLALHREAEAA